MVCACVHIVNFNVSFLWFEQLLCHMYLVDSIKVKSFPTLGSNGCGVTVFPK